MRLSFSPSQVYIINTDLTVREVHGILSKKFTADADSRRWWVSYYSYTYTYYMGAGDTLRIENKMIKDGWTQISIIGIGYLKSAGDQTIINVQYDGYLPGATSVILWSFTILGALCSLILLCAGAWIGLLISSAFFMFPQLFRIYLKGLIRALHLSVFLSLKNASNN